MTQKIAKKEISKREAEQRTAQHKRDFAGLKKGWSHLGREVARSVDLGVPVKLGMTMRAWLDSTFEESSSNIFAQLKSYRALKGVPDDVLDAMPASNAAQLTRLPQKDRIDAHIVSQAVSQKPKEFKGTVDNLRESKYGITKSEWATYARRVPKEIHDQMIEAEIKIAHVLQVDIAEDSEKRASNLILVLEAIAQLINGTDESRLKTEIEGDSQG